MMIRFGDTRQPKYLCFVFGKYWDSGSFKFLGFHKTPIGWDFNLWRLSVSYDNYANVNQND